MSTHNSDNSEQEHEVPTAADEEESTPGDPVQRLSSSSAANHCSCKFRLSTSSSNAGSSFHYAVQRSSVANSTKSKGLRSTRADLEQKRRIGTGDYTQGSYRSLGAEIRATNEPEEGRKGLGRRLSKARGSTSAIQNKSGEDITRTLRPEVSVPIGAVAMGSRDLGLLTEDAPQIDAMEAQNGLVTAQAVGPCAIAEAQAVEGEVEERQRNTKKKRIYTCRSCLRLLSLLWL